MKVFFLNQINKWICIGAFILKEKSLEKVFNLISSIKKEVEIFQLVDADKICHELQILSAIYRTYRAFYRNKNIAKDLSIEFLIKVSGSRNIKDAFKIVGLNEETRNIITISCDKDLDKAKRAINKTYLKLGKKYDDSLIRVYSKEKKIKLINTYKIISNFILEEILSKISSVEFYE